MHMEDPKEFGGNMWPYIGLICEILGKYPKCCVYGTDIN